jgi:hypothetical protein
MIPTKTKPYKSKNIFWIDWRNIFNTFVYIDNNRLQLIHISIILMNRFQAKKNGIFFWTSIIIHLKNKCDHNDKTTLYAYMMWTKTTFPLVDHILKAVNSTSKRKIFKCITSRLVAIAEFLCLSLDYIKLHPL